MAHPRAGRPLEPPPVKFLAAILCGGAVDPTSDLFPLLERILGRIDHAGPAHPFDVTAYYEDEMGPGLRRMIVSFEGLRPATDLVEIKHGTAGIEEALSSDGRRRANIDPGYMDFFKVVLASFKEGPQKVYLGRGVHADPVLLYRDGLWVEMPWTFPDFRRGLYHDDLSRMRSLYRKARR